MTYREETIGDCRKRHDGSVAIYALYGEDGVERYVGKTEYYLHVRHKAHIRDAKKRNIPVRAWLQDEIEAGRRLGIKLLEYVPSGADWASREAYWIEVLSQRRELLNLTFGGEGMSGHVPSAETRQAISQRLQRGAWHHCHTCGDRFWRKPKDISQGNNKFCSRDCYSASLRGVTRAVPHACKVAGIDAAAEEKRRRVSCKRGHPLSGDNLFFTAAGSRGCKECRKIHKATYRARLENG